MQITGWILLRRNATQFAAMLCLLAGALHAASAAADVARESEVSSKVRYVDLDLARPDAVVALYHRIQAAARRVCKASVTYRYLRTAPARQDCYRLTVDDAVNRAGLAALSALHREQLAALGH